MRIVAIDPGTANTGLIYMDERRVLCAMTLHYHKGVGTDQYALLERARDIARRIDVWLTDKPHECIVIEGYIGYSGRQGAYTYQTPYLCGFLHKALAGERIEIQTSKQVLNPRMRGNLALLKDALSQGNEIHPGSELCSNDHLRSACVHGLYYLKKEGLWNDRIK